VVGEKAKTPPPDQGDRLQNPKNDALNVENLYKDFGELKVLKGISMTAKEGDVISLIGSSGSGKSTFLRCINLLEKPTSGDIYVGGERIRLKTNRKGEEAMALLEKDAIRKIRANGVYKTINDKYFDFDVYGE